MRYQPTGVRSHTSDFREYVAKRALKVSVEAMAFELRIHAAEIVVVETVLANV